MLVVKTDGSQKTEKTGKTFLAKTAGTPLQLLLPVSPAVRVEGGGVLVSRFSVCRHLSHQHLLPLSLSLSGLHAYKEVCPGVTDRQEEWIQVWRERQIGAQRRTGSADVAYNNRHAT